jgi:parallel beta-helix repeat protein
MLNIFNRRSCQVPLLFSLILLLPGLLFPALPAFAEGTGPNFIPIVTKKTNVFYLSPQGDDSNDGSYNAPWQTPQHAADNAPSGATIYLRAGTYHYFTISRPQLTFTSYPGESVIFTGNGQEQHTIMIRDTSHVTIQGLTIQDNNVDYGTGIHIEDAQNILIRNNLIQGHQGFGIVIKNSSDVIVQENELTDNANAIEVRYGSAGVLLLNNLVHHNQRDVDSGRAAMGINFYYTTGPVTAQGNWLWENHTIDRPDPGGSAFEIYAASNVIITGNTIWDNETVLETGTDSDKTPCSDITFTRNLVYRGSRQQGLILRCASNSLIAHNTFDGLDNYVFNLSHYKGEYGASIEGLRIMNNIAVDGRVYMIETALPASVEIDHNMVYNPGSDSDYGEYIAYVEDFGNTNDFTEFKIWTAYEPDGQSRDPLFVDQLNRDYHLQDTSPAIDAGMLLDEPYSGSAPDMGMFEYDQSLLSLPIDRITQY